VKHGAILTVSILAGCSLPAAGQHVLEQQTPPVRAVNGGNADLEVLVCMVPASAAEAEKTLHVILFDLQHAGLLVSADNSTARLTLSFCPNV
jgi:hypothetical protein